MTQPIDNSIVMEGMFSESADVELGGFGWADPGRYAVRIVKAEPARSKKGIAMLSVQLTIEDGEFAGVNAFDYICLKGGGGDFWARAGKKKLLGLGIQPNSDAPVPAQAIAQHLLGKLVYADFDVEPRLGKDAAGGYTIPQYTLKDGQNVQQMQNRVLDYYTTPVNGAQAGAPAQQQGFQGQPPVQNYGNAPTQLQPPQTYQGGPPVQQVAPNGQPPQHVAFPGGGPSVAPQGWNNAPPLAAEPPKGRSRAKAQQAQ